MSDYKIHIEQNIDEATLNLIEDYWLIENNEFTNTLTFLTKKYNLKQLEITKLIKANSVCIIYENCIQCEEVFERKVETKGNFKHYSYKCENCEILYNQEIERVQKEKYEEKRKQKEQLEKEKQDKFDLAIQNKRWLDLNDYQLEVLNKILQSENLKDIKRTVFNGNFYDKFVWSAVNKLDKLGLIIIERGWGNQVENIEYSNDLIKHLNTPFKSKIADYLSFSLSKKDNKTTSKQPDYSGTFTLPTDVVLKSGVKYIYGGWIQTDNSINLKLTPLSDIETVKQTKADEEPKIIRYLINDFFTTLTINEDDVIE